MAVVTKVIKNRIRSIGNTKKITKAMEMVSAVKMRKAVSAVLLSKEYAKTAWQVILNLSDRVDSTSHPLLAKPNDIKKIGIVLISANRGLCGGFNSQIIAKALDYESRQKNIKCEWIVLGKKGADFLARLGKKVVAQFEKPDIISDSSEISAVVKLITTDYLNKRYDKIVVAYTDFYSALIQKPRIFQLLPLTSLPDKSLGFIGGQTDEAIKIKDYYEYLFEPKQKEILGQLIPRIIEIQIYQAFLESAACEHSARMMAMKNASEAALDMISELTLMFNQARQAAITREIAEITGSKAALE